ncbi:hypothetical protein [Halostagnicola bangensis]
MNTVTLYYVSLAVCGGVLGLMGLSSILAGSVALVPVLLVISGIGMVIGVAYEVFISPPSTDSAPDDRLVWIMTGLAAVGVIGGIWSLLG